jgi:hypothetical protein
VTYKPRKRFCQNEPKEFASTSAKITESLLERTGLPLRLLGTDQGWMRKSAISQELCAGNPDCRQVTSKTRFHGNSAPAPNGHLSE